MASLGNAVSSKKWQASHHEYDVLTKRILHNWLL